MAEKETTYYCPICQRVAELTGKSVHGDLLFYRCGKGHEHNRRGGLVVEAIEKPTRIPKSKPGDKPKNERLVK